MPRFAANVSMMYSELPFLYRLQAAARDGFKAVEFQFPYGHPAAAIASWIAQAEVEVALFNLPPGNFEAGERGLAALPGREAEFAGTLDTALSYAGALAGKRLHVMAGVLPATADRVRHRKTYVDNLRLAAGQGAQPRITPLIQPVNTRG